MTDGKIVPFGKYRGQPVEVLQTDHAYCDWLTAQDWFRERYGGLWTVIVNNFAEPSETPEHNALQAKFLDQRLCQRLAAAVVGVAVNLHTEIKTVFEVDGWDVHFRDRHRYFNIEVKPSLGDDYPAVLRQMKVNWRRCTAITADWHHGALVYNQFTAAGATLDQVRTIFDRSGFAVLSIAEISEDAL